MVNLPPRATRRDGFLIAHRAGNDLHLLSAATQLGARLAECDLRLHRGGVEVRHLKTLGPLPILWDTWHIANPFARRLQLHELLDAVHETEIELMLDLKGRKHELSQRVLDALDARRAHPPVTVCARSWHLLEPFEERPDVRTVCSVGSQRGLERLLREQRVRRSRLGGVSIHARLLNAEVVARLREAAEVVMTWPVNNPAQASMLLDWGVHGLITDEADRIAPVLMPASARSPVPIHHSAA